MRALVRSPLSPKKLVYLDGEKAVLYRSRMNPFKRTIQRMIEKPLAVEVLAGRFAEGDTIVLEPDGETLKFRHAPSPGEPRGEAVSAGWVSIPGLPGQLLAEVQQIAEAS